MAIDLAAKIPDDRDGARDEMEYYTIAHHYARLGDAGKTFALVDLIGSNAKENALFGIASEFAAGGYDDLAFQTARKLKQQRSSLTYGAIAGQQAKRGDLQAWEETIKTQLKDRSGLVYAYHGLAEHYYNRGDMQNARNAILLADILLPEGELRTVTGIWKSRFVDFALEKLQDPTAALTITKSAEPSISAIKNYADIVAFLQKTDRQEETPNIISLADENAEAIVNRRGSLYDWTKPYAQMVVADMYIKAGETEEGTQKIDEILAHLKGDRFDIAQRLASQGSVDAALYISDFDNPLTQLVIYETIFESLIKAKDIERAKKVLTTGAELAKNLAQQDHTTSSEYLPGHLQSLGNSFVQLGESEAAKELFDLAFSTIKNSARNQRKRDYELAQLLSNEVQSFYFERATRAVDETMDPGRRIEGYIKIASGLISAEKYEDAYQTLLKAEELISVISSIGVVFPEPQLALATQHYRLMMLQRQNDTPIAA